MKQDTGELTCNGGIYWLREHVTLVFWCNKGKLTKILWIVNVLMVHLDHYQCHIQLSCVISPTTGHNVRK